MTVSIYSLNLRSFNDAAFTREAILIESDLYDNAASAAEVINEDEDALTDSYVKDCLLGYYPVQSGRWLPTFRRNILLPPSGYLRSYEGSRPLRNFGIF